MRIAIDTNRYSDFARGVPEAVEQIRMAERVFVPFIVLGELRAGFRTGSREVENERKLVRFLGTSRVEVLLPDEQTTHHYAAIYKQLRRQGTPIPSNDMWIAALVLQHGVALFARDRHFEHLPQMQLIR